MIVGASDERRGDGPIAGFLDIPERSAKPREHGITHVIDRGLSVAEVDGLLEVAGASRRHRQARLGHRAGERQPEGRSSSATRRTGSRSCSAAR